MLPSTYGAKESKRFRLTSEIHHQSQKHSKLSLDHYSKPSNPKASYLSPHSLNLRWWVLTQILCCRVLCAWSVLLLWQILLLFHVWLKSPSPARRSQLFPFLLITLSQNSVPLLFHSSLFPNLLCAHSSLSAMCGSIFK